jgi:hypothetical protein
MFASFDTFFIQSFEVGMQFFLENVQVYYKLRSTLWAHLMCIIAANLDGRLIYLLS